MSFNLIESVKEVFSSDMTNKLAGLLGESQANLQKGLQGGIPSVLTGIILKSEITDVHDYFRMVTEASKIEIPFNLNSLTWWWDKKSVGTDHKKIIFEERASELSDALAVYAGISKHSASALLSVATPAALGVLGKHLVESKMNAQGLRSFLNDQKRAVLNEMPTGIFLEGILGFGNLTGISEKLYKIENPQAAGKAASKWIIPAIILVIAVVATWYFINRPATPAKPVQNLAPAISQPKDTLTKSPVLDPRYSIKLPDGTVLFTMQGSLEDQLFRFFNDPAAKASRRYAYNFDQLDFDPGSKSINSEGMIQVQHVASVLKAFPKARIAIGAFNSRGGDSIQNKILCENRAFAVAAAMKASGINANQITGVVSFGSDFARYPRDAADSLREKDNRIAISVRAK